DAVATQSHPEVEKINYVHHAGNSSGIVDGAGAVLLGSKEAGSKHGLKARAKIRAFANIGSEPAMMLTGPVDVTEKLFERSGMKKSDIDLFELNEAFAAVVLRYIQAFDIDNAKINVNGGAIALGHPLGATGAMILGTVQLTWDIPDRSMNVVDETTMSEHEEIVKQTSADAAVKGVVVTSGKEAFPAGADLSMLEGMNRRYTELLKAKGEVAANQMLF